MRLLSLFIIFLFSVYLRAEVLIQGQAVYDPLNSHDLSVFYSGSQYNSHVFDLYSREYLLNEIYLDQENNKKTKLVKTEIVIPFGPSYDFSELEKEVELSKYKHINLLRKYNREQKESLRNNLEAAMASMDESELKLFLSKKHEFLSDIGKRMETMFKALKIKPKYRFINSFIKMINNTIYLKSKQFLKSNTVGVPIYLTVGFGSALGRLLYDTVIVHTPLKKMISPNFGFYFLTSFGFAVSYTNLKEKKLVSFDLFYDWETFKKVLTPVFEVFGGLGFGVFFEARKVITKDNGGFKILNENSYKDANYLPVVGMIKSGPQDVSINQGLGLSFPLMSFFLENKFKRNYYHIPFFSFKEKQESKTSFIDKFVNLLRTNSSVKSGSSCNQYYF